ncbi:MAG: winged helix-turn-helix domain-containing protein [Parabacteroides sp.]|nr:winged helix-turn-helix domain-containing protein [Parabacteroides sp.]
MNKRTLYAYGVGVFIVCWTITCFFLIKKTCHRQEEVILSRITSILRDAVKIEQKSHVKVFNKYYDSELSPNIISIKEKEEWCNQFYFNIKDPNRSCLDSIFNSELKRKKIKAQGVLGCTYKGKTTYSSPDSLFRQEATPLTAIIYRFDENPNNNITLQAYVHYSKGWLYLNTSMAWLIIAIWLICVIEIISSYKFWIKKEIQKKQEENLYPIETHIVAQWFELPGGARFDKEHGIILYKKHKILLTPNSNAILTCLLEADNYSLTHEQLYSYAYNRKYQEELTREEKSTLSQAIKRLKEQLAPIDYIHINASRGKGYQLTFEQPLSFYSSTRLYELYKKSALYEKSYPLYNRLSLHFKKPPQTTKIKKKRGRPKKTLYDKAS